MNKQGQYRLISGLNLLMLLACFALLGWLSMRYQLTADLTRSGRHTLSQASQRVLTETTQPLAISAFAREDSQLRGLIRNFVGRFQGIKPDISLEFINPDAVPDEVRKLGINVNGELVLRYDGRIEHVRSENEQEFVNALQRLLRGSERWLAFLDGHGERHPSGQANHDLGEWANQLKYRGYKLRPLNLSETGTVPDNTSVLVIASPLVALLPGEIDIIRSFLEQGGNLLWLNDPGDASGMHSIAEQLGLEFSRGVVIDTAGQLLGINDATITLTTPRLYPEHPITEGFDLTVFFPKASAVKAVSRPDAWETRALLSTGNHTWLEQGNLSGEVNFDPELEQQGPLTLGLSLEKKPVGASDRLQRIVVIADGDFLSNTYVGNSGNMELGMRIVNWLSSDDELITIPASTVEDANLEMSQFALGSFALGFLLVLPLGFLASGARVWWRRKKL